MALSTLQLGGRDDSHLHYDERGRGLQPECWQAFRALQAQAATAGFDLQIAGAWRSFERQCSIWNDKASGRRAVHDDAGAAIDIAALSDPDKLHAMLRFSALPGASRHHWGSDLDVYDAAAMPAAYQLQLSPQEVSDSGLFGPLHRWLDERIRRDQAQGFFRPYDMDRGGIAPERWHLSYRPLARDCAARLSPALLRPWLADADLLLGSTVLEQLEPLFARYVRSASD